MGMDGQAQGVGRLVAVVVTHDRLAQLKVTLARLLETPAPQLNAIVVIDNRSSDGTAEWLVAQGDPRLVVHRSAVNLGGAGGFETGMRLAVERFDPDWIVVMDDDARPHPGALERFHAGVRTTRAAWAAAVYHPDGRICDINRPSVNPFWHGRVFAGMLMGRGRDGFHMTEQDYAATVPRAIDAASFVGLFLSREAIARAGYPDGGLFLYGDDVLYTLGLRAAGGRIDFDPELCFEHDFTTIDAAERRFRPLWKSYYHHRNLLLVYRRAAGVFFWPALMLIVPKWILKLRHHRGARRAYLRILGRALRDGLARRTAVDHAAIRALAPPEGGKPSTRAG